MHIATALTWTAILLFGLGFTFELCRRNWPAMRAAWIADVPDCPRCCGPTDWPGEPCAWCDQAERSHA